MAHVGLDGGLRDEQLLADLGVREPAADQPQTSSSRSVSSSRPRGAAAGGRHESTSRRVTGGASSDRRRRPPVRRPRAVAAHVLEQEAARSRAQRVETYSSRSNVVRTSTRVRRPASRSAASPRCRPCPASGCPSARRRAAAAAPARPPRRRRRPRPRPRTPAARGSAGSPRGPAPGRRPSRHDAVDHSGSTRRDLEPAARQRAGAAHRRAALRARACRRGRAVAVDPHRPPVPVSRTCRPSIVAPPDDAYARGRAGGVLVHVRQRLLDDPVRRQVEARGAAAAARPRRGASPASRPRARARPAPASRASPGCGASSGAGVVLAQHAQQPPHLGQRLLGRARGSRAAACGPVPGPAPAPPRRRRPGSRSRSARARRRRASRARSARAPRSPPAARSARARARAPS